MKWNTKNSMNTAYTEYYHKHPAYQNYPVVNISYEAALLYCEWLSAKYSEMYGSTKFSFRLPTKEEFIRAGRGDNNYVQYAWGSSLLRNSEGQVQCNFLQVGSESIHRDLQSGEYKIIPEYENVAYGNNDILAPAKSYWANQFGIYNMNGNAAEMISQKGIAVGGSWKNTGYDVRLESQYTYSDPNPSTGFRIVMTRYDSMF
jgi:formylglycine-generating enzyme required for sulfatase activity